LTPAELISTIRPDVLIKGSDYQPQQVVGREVVESYGGLVVCLPIKGNYSTTRLLAQA